MRQSPVVQRVQKTIGRYEKDLPRLEKELKALVNEGKRSGNALLAGAAYRAMAVLDAKLDRRDEMLSNSLKAVGLLENSREYDLLASAYNALGYAYADQENEQMALENYEKA